MKQFKKFSTSNDLHNILRILSMVLLVAAIFGPWGYTSDGVPPPEWCREPHFLQESRGSPSVRCVRFLPGAEILPFWGMGGLFLLMELMKGSRSLAEIGRELLIIPLFLMIVMPFASTLAVLARQETRGLRVFNVIAWGLALVPPFLIALIALLEPIAGAGRLWGAWLFAGVAAAALLLEILPAIDKRRANAA